MPLDITFSDHEIRVRDDETGVIIVPALDDLMDELQLSLFQKYYCRKGETPQEAFARTVNAFCCGDLGLRQRLYDAVSKEYFMFASPVLSNAPLPNEKVKGMPISCFLTYVSDSVDSIISHIVENEYLAIKGGGSSGAWSAVRSVSEKAPGPIPFLHAINAAMEAFRQGTTRKGSYAAYTNDRAPDIMEFVKVKTPTGDQSRKCHGTGFHNAVNITDAFMNAVINNEDWNLIDPHDKTVRDTLPARRLWEEILTTRYRTGEPYLFFIDEANRHLPESQKKLGLTINSSNLCSEITLPTNEERTAVCCLSSLNAEKYDKWKDTTLVQDMVTMLDNVLTYFIANAPPELAKAKFSASQERAIGVGLMGFHSYLQKKMIPFESKEAQDINKEMFAYIQSEALKASYKLGAERGESPDMVGTGRRHSHLIAIAPNANSAILAGTSSSIEPISANAYIHQTRAGSYPIKNRHLEALFQDKGMNTDEVWDSIIFDRGSVQNLTFLTSNEKAVFKTADEIDQSWVIQHAADRQPFICQAQSVNLFFPPRVDKAYFNRIHLLAWRKGLKSLYYTRTSTKNGADSVGQKKIRNALVNGDEINVETIKVETTITEEHTTIIINAESEIDCVSCQG